MGNTLLIAHIYLIVRLFKLKTLNSILTEFYKIINESKSVNVVSNCYEGLSALFTIIGKEVDPVFGDKRKEKD